MKKYQQYLDDYMKKSSVKKKVNWNDYTLESEYEYKDQKGNVLWYKRKYRHKDGKDKTLLSGTYEGKTWKSGLDKDVDKPLYRLPELIANKGKNNFILEGEKDTDNLRAWGYTAVCSPFGAKYWDKEYNSLFIGKKVFLIPDNDKDGQFFTQKIGENLIKVASSIQVLRLPDAKDFSEWKDKDKNNTEEKFLVLLSEAEKWKPEERKKQKPERIFITGKQLVEEIISEPVVPISKGLLVPERYTILAASDGEGKTTLCIQLALSVITATTFLGFFPVPKKAKVLYFCGENSRGDIKAKLEFQRTEIEEMLDRSIIEDLRDRLIIVEPININFWLNPKDKTELYGWIEDHKPDIVIFDPLADFISSQKSLSDDTLARGTVKILTELAQKYKCFPIITTHLKKEAIDLKTGRSLVTLDNVWDFVFGSRYWLNSAAAQVIIIRANLQRYPKAKRLAFKFKTVTEIDPLQVLRNPNLWYEELPEDKMSLASLTVEDVKTVLERKCKGEVVPSIFWGVAAKDLDCSQQQVRDLVKLGKKQGIFFVNKLGQLVSYSEERQKKLFNKE